jgi:hypothetical protein
MLIDEAVPESAPHSVLLDSEDKLRLIGAPAHEGPEGVSAGVRTFGCLRVNDYNGRMVGTKMS